MHRSACAKLAIRDYRQQDQRHSYAVRAVRSGAPAELVARQLGHANPVMVHKVYGRFAPNQEDRDKWERIASAQDAARKGSDKNSGTTVYHPVYHTPVHEKPKSRKPLSSRDLVNSRGGTRTHDPGIMSAVL
jgi:hypothetical protein